MLLNALITSHAYRSFIEIMSSTTSGYEPLELVHVVCETPLVASYALYTLRSPVSVWPR